MDFTRLFLCCLVLLITGSRLVGGFFSSLGQRSSSSRRVKKSQWMHGGFFDTLRTGGLEVNEGELSFLTKGFQFHHPTVHVVPPRDVSAVTLNGKKVRYPDENQDTGNLEGYEVKWTSKHGNKRKLHIGVVRVFDGHGSALNYGYFSPGQAVSFHGVREHSKITRQFILNILEQKVAPDPAVSRKSRQASFAKTLFSTHRGVVKKLPRCTTIFAGSTATVVMSVQAASTGPSPILLMSVNLGDSRVVVFSLTKTSRGDGSFQFAPARSKQITEEENVWIPEQKRELEQKLKVHRYNLFNGGQLGRLDPIYGDSNFHKYLKGRKFEKLRDLASFPLNVTLGLNAKDVSAFSVSRTRYTSFRSPPILCSGDEYYSSSLQPTGSIGDRSHDPIVKHRQDPKKVHFATLAPHSSSLVLVVTASDGLWDGADGRAATNNLPFVDADRNIFDRLAVLLNKLYNNGEGDVTRTISENLVHWARTHTDDDITVVVNVYDGYELID